MRAAKIAGIALGILLLLLALTLLAAKLLINPNEFKPRIVSAVRASTGRELSLPGDLKLGVFPWVSLELGPASLSNPPGFPATPFVAVQHLSLRVRLLPLLRKQLQIGLIEADGLQLNLQKDAQGRGNWQGLAGGPRAPAPSGTAAAGTSGALEDLAGVQLKDSRLTYGDLRAEAINLEIGRIHSGVLTPLSLKLRLTTSARATPTTVEARFSLRPDLGAGKLMLKDVDLTGTPVAHPKGAAPVVRFAAAEVSVDLDAQTLSAPQFSAQLDAARLAGTLQGRQLLDDPQLSGTFNLAAVSPRALLAALGSQLPPTRDPRALTQLSAAGAFRYGSNTAELQRIEVHLDGATLRGSAAVTDLKRDALSFDLSIDRCDFDRYRAPPLAAEPRTAAPRAPGPNAAPSALKSLLLQGRLRVGSATVANLHATQLAATVQAKDGVLRLAPVSAQFYGGAYSGGITVDSRSTVPQLTIDQSLTNVDVGPMLKDLAKSGRISGRGNVTTNLTAQGLDSAAIVRTLNGRANAVLNDGAIEGLDLWFEINRALTLLQKQSLAGGTGSGRTRFEVFRASADIRDGVATSKDLTVISQNLRVTGAGSVNLVNEGLDYRMNATVLRQPTAGAVTAANTLASLPVRIGGTLASPKVTPDLEGLARSRVEQELGKHTGELQQRLKDQLKNLIK